MSSGGRRRGGRKNGSGSTRQVRGRGGAGRQRLPPARIDGGGQPTATPSERRTSRRRIAGAGWRRERQPGGEGVTRSSGSRWARTPTDQAMVRWRGCAHGGVRAQVWQYRSGRLSRGGRRGWERPAGGGGGAKDCRCRLGRGGGFHPSSPHEQRKVGDAHHWFFSAAPCAAPWGNERLSTTCARCVWVDSYENCLPSSAT